MRKVPTKPSKVGLWHYQACVFLSNDEPFLVYTRAHDASKAMERSIKTSEIVSEWATVIEVKRERNLACNGVLLP
ncbi:hypothetical protein D6817_03135 [Candidatus Pacearchaeota archaeon]|nr:MAG: hypothetical protein D6817_03135 [Candidatus Pacearchaeota archaeon]